MVGVRPAVIALGCVFLVVVSSLTLGVTPLTPTAATYTHPTPSDGPRTDQIPTPQISTSSPVDTTSSSSPTQRAQTAASENSTAIDVSTTAAPRALAATPDESQVFVVLAGANAVLVLNTTTDTVTARIDLPDGGDPRGAVYHNGSLWVTDRANDAVHVIDPGTRSVVSSLSVAQSPLGIDATNNGTVVVAAWNGTATSLGALSVINAETRTVTDTIPVPATSDGGPRAVATCGDIAYVANDGRDTLQIVNTTTGTVGSLADGELPRGIDCTRTSDTRVVAMANAGADTIVRERQFSEISLTTGADGTEQVRWTQYLTGNVSNVTVATKDGEFQRTRVGDAGLTLATLDQSGTPTTKSVNLGIGSRYDPTGISITQNGSSILVADRNAAMVFRVNRSTGSIETTVHTGPAPTAVIRANGKLYVANSGTHTITTKGTPTNYSSLIGVGSITIHNSSNGQPVTTLLTFADERRAAPTGTVEIERTAAPRLLTSDPAGTTVYAPLSGTGDVLEIDTTTGTSTIIEVPGATDSRSAVLVGDELWVASFGNNSVHVIDTETHEVEESMAVCANPWQIDAENGTVGVACWSGTDNASGTVALINRTTREIRKVIAPMATNDGGPWGVSGCDNVFYITNDGTDDTIRVNLSTFDIDVISPGELPWEVGCGGIGPQIVVPANGGADIPMTRTNVEHTVIDGEKVWWNLTQVGPLVNETVTIDGKPWILQESFRLTDRDTLAYALDTTLGVSNDNGVIDQTEFDRAIDLFETNTPVPGTNGLTLSSSDMAALEERMKAGERVDVVRRYRYGHANAVFIPIAEDGTVLKSQKSHIPAGVGDRYEPWGVDLGPDATTGYITDMHINVVYVATTSSGHLEDAVHTGPAPRDSIVAASKLYVANSGTHTISSKSGTARKFDYTRNVLGPGTIGITNLETGASESVIAVVDQRSVPLALTANQTRVDQGDHIAFSVTRADTNQPLNATILVNNTVLVTGADGRVTHQVSQGENFTAVATIRAGASAPTPVVTFEPDELTISVNETTEPTGAITVSDQTVPNGSSTITIDKVEANVPVSLDIQNDQGVTLARNIQVFENITGFSRTNFSVTLTRNITTNQTGTVFLYTSKNNTTLDTATATITVKEQNLTLPGRSRRATNVDDDPVLEDLDGDGDFDIVDVRVFFLHRNSDVVQNNPEKFDINGDGTVDIRDIRELFVELP